MTNESGTLVVEKYAYDPWGARRNATDWTAAYNPTTLLTNRGYTGHEHLDMFNIINMNGRVYDPLTAMFFSPDPFIQSAGDWKNYNRYSYCMNNPTRYIDPSGYIMAEKNSVWFAPDATRWMNYGSGGGNAAFRAWDAQHRGSIDYDEEDQRFEYANGDVVGSGGVDYEGDNAREAYRNLIDGYQVTLTSYFGRQGAVFSKGDPGGYSLMGGYDFKNKTAYYLEGSQLTGVIGEGGYDWGRAGAAIGVADVAYDVLENALANKYLGWIDAKGKYNSIKLLSKGANGKYIQGVQGYRNGFNSAVNAASKFKVAGNIVGGLGLGVTGLQYYNNQITGFEASVDAAFGVISFMGPIGAGIGATYFVGKLGYEYFSGNTLFEKPQ